MEEKLISVVIPVYNVEAYLERCVLSVLKQDYIHMEVILIDDGSTDCSGQICDKIAEQDCRIKVIHKKNQGLGEARNTAIDVMEGKYVLFLDSDDYIYPGIINQLYTAITNHQADIACCGYKSGKKAYYCNGKVEVYESKEATAKMFCNDGMDANAWCKLYKSALFHNIRYWNCAYEVVPVTYKIFLKTKKVVSIGECGFYIEKRVGSITRTKFGDNHMLNVKMSKEVYEEIKKYCKELEPFAYVFYLNALISMAEKAEEDKLCHRTRQYEEIMKELFDNLEQIIRNENITIRKKIIVFLIRSKMYSILRKLYLCVLG